MPAMNVRVARRGPAGKYEMWARCRDPGRWPTWMTLVRDVETMGPLRPGLEGRLVLVAGIRIRFYVIDVNATGPSWLRELRLGPFRVLVDHQVDEGFGLVEITGPFPLPILQAPFARRSLSRLLRRGRQSPPVV
jgi:hypothetical protein